MKPAGRHTLIAYLLILMLLLFSVYILRRFNESQRHAAQAESRLSQLVKDFNQLETDIKLLKLASMIQNTLNMEKGNFEKAIILRDMIYNHVPLKDTTKNHDFMDIYDSFTKSIKDESVGHICGGLAKLYATALESQGIPARYVGLFSTNKVPYESHATIEFWDHGKWHASDPTFNIMFINNGNYLSYIELYNLIQSNSHYEITSNGFPYLPNRNIKSYYISIEKLMKYVVIYPGTIWHEGQKHTYPLKTLPKSWDGLILLKNKKLKDIKKPANIYDYLYKGPLR